MINVTELTQTAFEPYGHVLGKPFEMAGANAFQNAATDFRQEHLFDTGGGEPELLWVSYRSRKRTVEALETHRLTEQAIIPLTGAIIQVVAASLVDGSIDRATLRAFRVPVGKGICMRPGCWHATRVDNDEVACAMLTRRSTTVDLVAHLVHGAALRESVIDDIDARLAIEDSV